MPSRSKTWVAADGQFRSFDFDPGCVHALGLTYADHIREIGEQPGVPVVFRKTCILRPAPLVTSKSPTYGHPKAPASGRLKL